MTSTADCVAHLADQLRKWHAQARMNDKGTGPALNDPSPHARIRIAADDGDGRPGAVIAEIVLTERQAADFASALTSPTASATSAPSALAHWLARDCGARPRTQLCWFVACDAGGEPEGSVPLDRPSTEALAQKLDLHRTWLLGEHILRGWLPIQEGHRVEVIGTGDHLRGARGQQGIVVRTKLVDPDEQLWWYDVRLAGRSDVQTFADGELALSGHTR